MDEVAGVLTEDVVGTIRSAAEKLTGFRRRQFQAEVAERYCGGSARRAERIWGGVGWLWSRGWGNRRVGCDVWMRCINEGGRRRKRSSRS